MAAMFTGTWLERGFNRDGDTFPRQARGNVYCARCVRWLLTIFTTLTAHVLFDDFHASVSPSRVISPSVTV